MAKGQTRLTDEEKKLILLVRSLNIDPNKAILKLAEIHQTLSKASQAC